MFVLLDIHALIWLDQDHPSLGPEARKRADAALQQGRLGISAISFWETTILIAKGGSLWHCCLLHGGVIYSALDWLKFPLMVRLASQPPNSTCMATRRIGSSRPLPR